MTEPLRAALGESPAWVVGGTVRDELLGRPVTDVDVAVAGDAEAAARALAAELRGPVFRLSERFGAWRALDRRHGVSYDLSSLQGESIEEDLRRRDFSVNAMARPVAGGELLDPEGGRRDLDARVLRVLSPEAYEADPLRTLRLARFAAELGFAPDPETERITRTAVPRVTEASAERIFGELRRLVVAPGAVAGLELADRLGLLRAVLPELDDLHDVDQSRYHHLDVYGHTIEVLARQIELEGRLEDVFGEHAPALRAVLREPLADDLDRGQAIRLGALLHDVGKPATRGVLPDGRVTFLGHDELGERMVRDICRRLRTSERLSRFLEGLTRTHLVLGFLVHQRPLDRRAIYRYLTTTSPVEVEVTLLSCADRLATRGRKADEAIAAHLELAADLMAIALEWRDQGPPPAPVRGNDLARELGMRPGPELGRILRRLEEAVFTGEASDRDQAVELARSLRQNPEQ
ncbi:MAG: HDIG domain-containing protein [Thermoleophilaceae bacterium]|nr:HDIG domain-containing protein [Thermoleophilaceae bacterium]